MAANDPTPILGSRAAPPAPDQLDPMEVDHRPDWSVGRRKSELNQAQRALADCLRRLEAAENRCRELSGPLRDCLRQILDKTSMLDREEPRALPSDWGVMDPNELYEMPVERGVWTIFTNSFRITGDRRAYATLSASLKALVDQLDGLVQERVPADEENRFCHEELEKARAKVNREKGLYFEARQRRWAEVRAMAIGLGKPISAASMVGGAGSLIVAAATWPPPLIGGDPNHPHPAVQGPYWLVYLGVALLAVGLVAVGGIVFFKLQERAEKKRKSQAPTEPRPKADP